MTRLKQKINLFRSLYRVFMTAYKAQLQSGTRFFITYLSQEDVAFPIMLANEPARNKAKWSTHALMRAAEHKIYVPQLMEAWAEAKDEELSEKQKAYKFKKYGMESLNDRYLWSQKRGILFTVKVFKSRDGYESWSVMTVTKGRGNWNV